MKKLLSKLNYIFSIDNTKEGESNKLVMVMRILETVIMLYAVSDAIFCAINGNYIMTAGFVAVALLYLVIIHLSYHISTRIQIVIINAVAFFTIIGGFHLFGNLTRLHTFLIVLVVLAFFSEYGYYKLKAAYTCLLAALFLEIEFFGDRMDPYYELPNNFVQFFKAMDIIVAFICIAVLCYIYSRDSQHLEGKLLEYNSLLKKQASTDPLTGLCNRRSALEFINSLINKRTEDVGFCVSMCDIDFFKKVNDSYGHDIGDNVLRGMASTMLEGLPKSCLISRWGGEEFLIIFPQMNGDDARALLDVISSKIRKMEFRAGEKTFKVTVTFGLAEYGFNGDADALVKEADNKLYYGKEHGRNQVVF